MKRTTSWLFIIIIIFLIRIIISFDGFNGLQGTVQQREVVKHVKKEKL